MAIVQAAAGSRGQVVLGDDDEREERRAAVIVDMQSPHEPGTPRIIALGRAVIT